MTELFGISFSEKENILNDVFYKEEFGDDTLYITKKTYHHEEDGLVFDYKYILSAIPTEIFTNGSLCYNLEVVPMPNSLHQKHLEDVLDMDGYTIDDVDLTDTNQVNFLLNSIYQYGLSVNVGNEVVKGEHDMDAIANKCANIIPTIQILFGFYMDRKWNMIGNDGWDIIQDAINNKPMF